MKRWVIIGAAGFVAPRHMKAIKEVGGDLIACLDPSDSVGILDSYFPNCQYFREFERFDRFCSNEEVDFVSICSPNYLHSAHSIWALRIGASAICEKPLVLNPRNLDQLQLIEDKSVGKVWNILQMRLSPQINEMRQYIKDTNEVQVVYYTPRGDWYDYSWKSITEKSGGMIFNIGVHLIDLLLFLFGEDWSVINWENGKRRCSGNINIGNTSVSITLSIEKDKHPTRIFSINGHTFDLSTNFGDLHTLSYSKILSGEGFGVKDVFPAINLCAHLRSL
jgi:UDP-N-acetyl-2-amino-2-deoxyglucuronate dehydrogenase